ncbi:MAG: hypothetical protein HYX52_09430 [Chloroflexi bacterium]|nr:hypothetical protein [Chloroflexota bacterium]
MAGTVLLSGAEHPSRGWAAGRMWRSPRFVWPSLAHPGIPWRWLLLALAVRMLVSPLQHTWDSQTWWNVAAELGGESDPWRAVAAPFETMRRLSDLARGSGQREYYEYWAYPPGMLLVWWPIARLWAVLADPLVPQFAAPDVFTARPVPFLLALGMKTPVIIGDLVAGVLMARLTGNERVGRWYLFNPYVLLVGLWTFDGVMVALLLAGLALAERGRWAASGVALGLGASVKFVPALLVPAVALWAVRATPGWMRAATLTSLASAAAFLAVSGPWLDGLRYVLEFHAARVGGGMAWQAIWGALAWIDPFADLAPVYLYLSAQIGTLTLTGMLVLTAWVAWWRRLDLLDTSLALLLAYLAGSKLVNEAYALPAVALAAIAVARRPSPDKAVLLLGLWVLPLAFTAVSVPAWGFLLAPAVTLGWVDIVDARAFHAGYVLTYQYLAPLLALAGVLFQGFCVWGIWRIARRRPAPMRAPSTEVVRLGAAAA